MWPFNKGKPSASNVAAIIQLMQHRPQEWEVSSLEYDTESRGYYSKIASHKPSGLSLKYYYSYKHDNSPANVRFWHVGSEPKLVGSEKRSLLTAFGQLQLDRINRLAQKYLKLENPINCCQCQSKIKGWAWLCKCQAALHQNCYSDANVCPECGGTLVEI